MYIEEYHSGTTDTCLSYINDKILKGFHRGEIRGMILIDLQNAFDTTDHKMLVDKLVSDLSNRSSIANVETDYSKPGDLTLGVQHGSILEPLHVISIW